MGEWEKEERGWSYIPLNHLTTPNHNQGQGEAEDEAKGEAKAGVKWVMHGVPYICACIYIPR